MKISLPNDPWLPASPVTRSLILLNLLVWLTGSLGDVFRMEAFNTESILLTFGLFPQSVAGDGTLWTPFTHMFLHGNGTHLLVNMLGLFLLGPDLERTFGTVSFLLLYLLSGLVGGVGYMLFSFLVLGQLHPVVGASGAIMGILGAIVALFPGRVYVILPLMIPLRASTLAVLMLTAHVFFMFTPYGGRVAYDVHLYGGLTGYGFAWWVSRRHMRRVRARSPELDPARDAAELEGLVVRRARGTEPLSDEELQRYAFLKEALRYEDVLTLEELEGQEV
ncbi:MAG: rhomboid family intramembrane serine protease [Verrucomicrobia bacterium]|nr:rhomboid family intramembrane serine protease [Verrucomicrobiota bacterium]MCH8528593.1 rhomboid family intramembrane serine protease [Kiritimatiellia bacterium]